MRLHKFTINMRDSGGEDVFPGSGVLDEARDVLERWLRRCHQGNDYFYDPIEAD